MQVDAGEALAQRRPLALRLLHAVLAEGALAGLQRRQDVLGGKRLAHADERHALGGAPAVAGGTGDAQPDVGEAGARVVGMGHAGQISWNRSTVTKFCFRAALARR